MLYSKILLYFLGILKNSAFPELEVWTFGNRYYLCVYDYNFEDTEIDKMIYEGGVCAEKCFLAKSRHVFENSEKLCLPRNSKYVFFW